jgi:hypothetical protein
VIREFELGKIHHDVEESAGDHGVESGAERRGSEDVQLASDAKQCLFALEADGDSEPSGGNLCRGHAEPAIAICLMRGNSTKVAVFDD